MFMIAEYYRERYLYSDYFIKLGNYKTKIKEILTINKYCKYIGHHHDLHHFKYKKPSKTGANCYHDKMMDRNHINDYKSFFQYCYYINMHRDENEIYQILEQNNNFNKYFINISAKLSCSAVSAVILAKLVSIRRKRQFIKILLDNNFRITEGDKLLASVELYDNMSISLKNKIILFLLSDLLEDIKHHIIKLIINQDNPLPQ
jgi:hypothetical protein